MTESPETIAQLNNVRHRYGAVTALDDVSLSLPGARMIGLIGPDGVGKSTLMGLIAGAKRLQTGAVHCLGGDMNDARHRARMGGRIAFMPQGLGRNLYHDLSVRENLEFFGKLFGLGRADRSARIDRLTRATGLYPFLDRPAGKLSGGMKQKLGLCSALIHDPDFLLLDEPTTGVDPLSRRQFWDLIDAIRADRPQMSVLVSTAYMEEAARFDHLVAMGAGRVLAEGSPTELMQRTGSGSVGDAYVRLMQPEGTKDAPENAAAKLDPADAPLTTEIAILARGLTRRFGDFTAVDSVSFEIARGEIFGFLGSNGCGKTTTMKMLTGLLPATEGEAWIFDRPIEAQGMNARRRVGFMSQAFSLYGELSVRENLMLHARLFHLGAALTAQRLADLVPRFGLTEHLDQRADDLPLGLRQRLSLAVAVIHSPDILILDEPTSGVDPQARDDFWQLLLELSRRDRVTIFVSTHFMDEAMRCDRMSLMHAGKVLVTDTPAGIIAQSGTTSLEEAFISFISAALPPEEPSGPTTLAPESDVVSDAADFSLRRLFAYTEREAMQVWRDPVRLAFAFLGSALLLLIMSFGISQEVRDIPFAALDHDQSPESRAYLSAFEDTEWFAVHSPIRDALAMETRLKSGELALALEIPPGFGADLRQGSRAEVAANLDGADTGRAGTIESYVAGAHAVAAADMARGLAVPTASPLVQLVPRFRYNPTMASLPAIGPSIPPLLLLLFPAILMAVSVAREKEIGTITNFYVTPSGRAEFLIGKQLVYIGITLLNFAILTTLVVLVLGVPMRGNPMLLLLATLVYAVAATGFGLLVSMMSSTQVTAVFASTVLSVMPTLQFSGMLTPVSSLEGPARVLGSLWPTTWYMAVSVGSYTKGLGFADLSGALMRLAVFGPLFTGLAIALLRKQER
ncbi:ribosome-associated ATPase/putative transporter RbbA [Pseudothioclava nitratireducens]|jgi:ribosome-dependent ATPase|uniref:ribosome-associated ATPase/putative transporter RbbA n=1 Tax=Pseudothioclava nitratireducens TaxID=1928646 RepID=UPI0023DAD0E6|nr:ribosome-associated ATPase/putative transporter RbbA [Defluviimonas nitratireducens]MDF1621213.1 ribosome-associated ATPase/putative transporter RbbA [Defluviimonas nitratireducens]